MCNDHAPTTAANAAPALTRRGLLIAAGAGTAAAMLLGDGWQSRSRAVAPQSPVTTFDGLSSRSMAMHVHSSFSEGAGSMEAHLLQARQNAVDVLWWTDHDHRMSAHGYRHVVHFTGLSNEKTDGVPWVWQKKTSGAFSSSSAGIVSAGSPNDTIKTGSLSLAASSKGTSTATIGYLANTSNANYNQRANVYGQQLTIEVLPTSVGLNGYLELLLTSSYHPARGDRQAGQYSVSYRFGGAGTPGTRTAQGIAGVVNVAVTPGTWNTVTLTPGDDIAALWADMDGRDFTTFDITLRAVSIRGFAVRGGFDYLRFDRQYSSGDVPLQTQQSISDGYLSAFPEVTPRAGVEMSTFSPHVNWFGGTITMPDYTGVVASTYLSFMQAQVGLVHAAGGLTSYNHPYGTAASVSSTATQNSKMSSLAKQMLATRALGCDILEVGYPKRGGADLAHHVGLWDIMSRNGVMLTGNGTNDDHAGQNWAGIANNWTTSVWTTSTDEADLLQALSAGRAWACSIRVPLTLDLLVDGECPMGSASVASVPSRQLEVFATGVPAGGKVSVLRGAVDYAGPLAAVPNTVTVASYADTDLASGSVSLPVDTSSACFVRAAVSDRTGTVVGLSNPVWLLDKEPLAGIPAARAR
jgi:hypothetical protein